MTSKAANVRSNQVSALIASWVEITEGFQRVLTLYAEDQPLLVCSGHDTPLDALAFKIPAASALELTPIPAGKVFVKSVTANQTVYLIGA